MVCFFIGLKGTLNATIRLTLNVGIAVVKEGTLVRISGGCLGIFLLTYFSLCIL